MCTIEADMIDFSKKGAGLGAKYGIEGQGSGKLAGVGGMQRDEEIKAIADYVRSMWCRARCSRSTGSSRPDR